MPVGLEHGRAFPGMPCPLCAEVTLSSCWPCWPCSTPPPHVLAGCPQDRQTREPHRVGLGGLDISTRRSLVCSRKIFPIFSFGQAGAPLSHPLL